MKRQPFSVHLVPKFLTNAELNISGHLVSESTTSKTPALDGQFTFTSSAHHETVEERNYTSRATRKSTKTKPFFIESYSHAPDMDDKKSFLVKLSRFHTVVSTHSWPLYQPDWTSPPALLPEFPLPKHSLNHWQFPDRFWNSISDRYLDGFPNLQRDHSVNNILNAWTILCL